MVSSHGEQLGILIKFLQQYEKYVRETHKIDAESHPAWPDLSSEAGS
jgi:hypothetical protein